jgi:hypothetical protein
MKSQLIMIGFIVVAVSLAIAPVYWMRPSPRQRQLARLREYALTLGLRPELSSVPEALARAGHTENLIKYQWHRPAGDWPRDGGHWLALQSKDAPAAGLSWSDRGDARGPDDLLALNPDPLPDGLFAIEAGPTGVGFYWHEAGDKSRVDELFALLQPWVERYRQVFAAPLPADPE